MKLFLDTVNIEHIKDANKTGLIDGITTNPSLISASGLDFKQTIKEICSIIDGDVSAEVASEDYETMLKEADTLSSISSNIVIKLPLTEDGLRVCSVLREKKIKTNVTLCFCLNQALLAAKAGATYISPFLGRLDDIGHSGIELIAQIKNIYKNYEFKTQILAASIRHPQHITQVAKIGADVATLPTSVFYQLYKHPLTDKGLETFKKDWEKTGQII